MVGALVGAGVPLPQIAGGTLGLGAIGLTASAGVAGWVEFLLLRSALGSKIGRVQLPVSFQLRLWGAALGGAAVALGGDQLYARVAHGHRMLSHPIAVAIVVAGLYGVAYFAGALALRVPEARRTVSRFLPA
jgi:putative peptidoglycan lipid II flippase